MKSYFLFWCKANPVLVNPSLHLLIRKGFSLFSCIWMRAITILAGKEVALSIWCMTNLESRTPLPFVFSVSMKVCSNFKFALSIFQQGIHFQPHCKKDIVA